MSAWFGGFSHKGIRKFRGGARPLATYALAHRQECWPLLRWRRHSKAPVTVATRTSEFAELLVPETVRNLWRADSAFWRSPELMRACASGEWIAVDASVFARVRPSRPTHRAPRDKCPRRCTK